MTTPFCTLRTVTIPFPDLENKNLDLSNKIEESFGRNGVGIISISNVPHYPSLRQNLLNLAPKLANLSDDIKNDLEDANSRYNFGWSHGREMLESGKPDLFKGSYYANPIFDVSTDDELLIKRFPSYCGTNIWPGYLFPELEPAFKLLGKVIHIVGMLLAYHCDQYVSKELKLDDSKSLHRMLLRSRSQKGRLLYYYPISERNIVSDAETTSSWCGWHTDHGILTGLTRAIYTLNNTPVRAQDSASGLYVRTRSNEVVKVVYDEDEIAYQIGEVSQILSNGFLCATPHCVRAPNGSEARGVDRSTFALFMQPNWDEQLNIRDVVHFHGELIPSNCSVSFGEYTEKLLDKYYNAY